MLLGLADRHDGHVGGARGAHRLGDQASLGRGRRRRRSTPWTFSRSTSQGSSTMFAPSATSSATPGRSRDRLGQRADVARVAGDRPGAEHVRAVLGERADQGDPARGAAAAGRRRSSAARRSAAAARRASARPPRRRGGRAVPEVAERIVQQPQARLEGQHAQAGPVDQRDDPRRRRGETPQSGASIPVSARRGSSRR